MVEGNFLNFIKFQELNKWYVEYYLNEIHLKSNYNLVLLRKLISPEKRLIKKENYKGEHPIVDKIVFKTGNIVFRKERTTGMNLYKLEDNELLVSNINFHQGATALNTFGEIVASTHYQPYRINKELIDSDYLLKILRAEPFLSMVSGKKAQGIKNESGYDFIGGFKIPVPPLEEQKSIIQNYNDAISKAESLEKQAEEIENSINIQLLDLLSINRSIDSEKSNSFLKFRKLSKCERWDVDYLIGKNTIDYIYTSKYPIVPVKDFVISTQYGSSSKADRNTSNTPVLRMNNIQKGELNISDLKYLSLNDKDLKNYKLHKGDFLFNRTNSKELVGKTAIFDLDGDYVFASYLIRVILDTSKVNTYYVNYLFGSIIVRDQIDLISRQILGQANVNVDEMKDFIIPLPPLSVQEEIVSHINEIKANVKSLRKQASDLRTKAKQDFENTVFN